MKPKHFHHSEHPFCKGHRDVTLKSISTQEGQNMYNFRTRGLSKCRVQLGQFGLGSTREDPFLSFTIFCHFFQTCYTGNCTWSFGSIKGGLNRVVCLWAYMCIYMHVRIFCIFSVIIVFGSQYNVALKKGALKKNCHAKITLVVVSEKITCRKKSCPLWKYMTWYSHYHSMIPFRHGGFLKSKGKKPRFLSKTELVCNNGWRWKKCNL
jgi:hypothetical protein